MIPNGSATLLLAVVIMGGLAAAGFNRPSWARSNTTFVRYQSALVIYVGFYLVVLLVVHSALASVQEREWVSVWGAFAFAVMLRMIPSFSRWLRARLHSVAHIPGRARELSASLANADMRVSEKVQAQANGMLRALGIGSSCDWLPKAQPLHEQLTRAAWLFVQIREWEEQPAFEAFVTEASNELFRLRQRFDAMSFRVSRMLASIELLGQIKYEYSQHAHDSERIDDYLRRMIGDMIADACEDISLFHRDSCVLATRGVLATEKTRRGRVRAFVNLGFYQREMEPVSPYRVLPFAGALLFVGMWLVFQVVGFREQDLKFLPLMLVIIVINLGAIAIAIVSKQNFGFANGGLRGRTPWKFIFGAGAAAVAFGVSVQLLVGGLMNGWWEGALHRLQFGWPYLTFAFFAASTTAWLMQDHRWPGTHREGTRRAFDSGVFGMAWLTAAVLTTLLLPAMHVSDAASALHALQYNIKTIASSFLLGEALGWFVPEYLRRRTNLPSDSLSQRLFARVMPRSAPEPAQPPTQLA